MFDAMPKGKIIECIKWCYSNGNNGLIITLTDGNTLCGYMSTSSEGILKRFGAKNHCYNNAGVFLCYEESTTTIKYVVPFKQISGISYFSFRQVEYKLPPPIIISSIKDVGKEKHKENSTKPVLNNKENNQYYSRDNLPADLVDIQDEHTTQRGKHRTELVKELVASGKYFNEKSIRDELMNELLQDCNKFGIDSISMSVTFGALWDKSILFGEIKAKCEFPMYADWEYISAYSGGVNSIGAGISVFSASAGWQNSLYSFREKLMKKRIREIKSIGDDESGSVVIRAYIDFINVKMKKKRIAIPHEVMEGDEWFPIILSEEPIKDDQELQLGKICIGYMRTKCMLVPKCVFEATQVPLKIQGEILPISMKTPLGNMNFVIKIRNISSK